METSLSETLYLGIDGGGTASRARLADQAGRVLGEGLAGSSNLTLGIEHAAASIRAAAEEAFAAAGLPRSEQSRVAAGLGLAGANVPSLARGIRAAPFPFASVALASDAVAACLGAHGGKDGAILILGTGSQGLALVGGKATAIGGWGFLVSDDGSGAILGRQAIRASVLACDSLAPRSPLTEAVMARFDDDPAQTVVWAKTALPRDYGTFAPLVFEHRAKGDPVATALVDEAVAQVANAVGRLHALGANRVALMGGLAKPYRPWLPSRLAPLLVEPQGDALDGALALARQGSSR
jgi:glucosamine kinase